MASWSRDEILIAYALYCVTPLSKINPSNKTIQQVAPMIGHSVSSLVLRMRNFQSLDPAAPNGMAHVAKADKSIYEEFCHDWGTLSLAAETLTGLALFDSSPLQGAKPLSSLTDRNKVSRERAFFRQSVRAVYDGKCYISGCALPGILVASHIKPFSSCRDENERTTPENGIYFNTFYDRAFDTGLMTITPDRKARISPIVKDLAKDEFTKVWLLALDGQTLPSVNRFAPRKEFLEYHNDMIFKKAV
ncbi:MAG: HNH endonuclease [Ruminococcus sp.]|nr:HNH endonuclease [Ruminococcus sp.]